ncbi:NAD(+) synthase [Mycoplasmoides genitalium]|uniref:NH(3)-dependent NAD(+) synthetase n=2 Tax=Mycoplasmoides genitalium TaxID=2097 RepID=NADE_MYCGE|nr:NAD(+) synthase [Mycoplasmoides genitalium]P47623.1 RecName: Full=NH(3)-dependent NAD(+) synthetase [Mycoplasmoides genitalium G37]ABY79574.1 NH(3)-dependent NAD+ synthetase, putative [synthetic Mycoplasma genitalium JCVI-1.0]AAC71610.1 NH(3)-dependent NAD+ synthetase, putative [Mycoplasmoides genitalium G37]AFQ03226.1 NH(3)-dependent NAD+ synthetase [Mycoplasmoides genitalium M2321]AFQ03709.1 NH(3)-dependent NAD+ synthetase [Mycoplasmoides genitalium M6282]AFQ04218.1 NH(3)-dependent NAD+ 
MTNLIKYLKELQNWLFDYVKKSKAKGVIFGLSGGIDSAVVAAIAKETFGFENHLALIMHINNSKLDFQATSELVKKMQFNSINIELEESFNLLVKTLGIDPKKDFLTAGNIKARLRMITLYAYAQKHNFLVLGTGNFVEYTLGYFTKWGDGACDIAPLAWLLKEDVYKLAKHFNIPEIVITRAPTASLFEGQTDETEMGITYKELDQYLKGDLILSSEKQKIVLDLKAKAEHKHNSPLKFKHLYNFQN